MDGAEDPEKYTLVEKLNATALENMAKSYEGSRWLDREDIYRLYVWQGTIQYPLQRGSRGTPNGVYGAT